MKPTPPPELVERLGFAFTDLDTLGEAFTHRSWCAEHPGHPSNERLEFLGDAVLGLVVTAHIHAALPDFPEGQLAKLRASVVNTGSLARIARQLGLGEGLLLGRGEDRSGGRDKESILADVFEAVIGAAYTTCPWPDVEAWVLDLMRPSIEAASADPGRDDHKTRLQETTARMGLGCPDYEISATGPDHDREFVAVVVVDGDRIGSGAGRSKKRAEQAAARAACNHLRINQEQVDASRP